MLLKGFFNKNSHFEKSIRVYYKPLGTHNTVAYTAIYSRVISKSISFRAHDR